MSSHSISVNVFHCQCLCQTENSKRPGLSNYPQQIIVNTKMCQKNFNLDLCQPVVMLQLIRTQHRLTSTSFGQQALSIDLIMCYNPLHNYLPNCV